MSVTPQIGEVWEGANGQLAVVDKADGTGFIRWKTLDRTKVENLASKMHDRKRIGRLCRDWSELRAGMSLLLTWLRQGEPPAGRIFILDEPSPVPKVEADPFADWKPGARVVHVDDKCHDLLTLVRITEFGDWELANCRGHITQLLQHKYRVIPESPKSTNQVSDVGVVVTNGAAPTTVTIVGKDWVPDAPPPTCNAHGCEAVMYKGTDGGDPLCREHYEAWEKRHAKWKCAVKGCENPQTSNLEWYACSAHRDHSTVMLMEREDRKYHEREARDIARIKRELYQDSAGLLTGFKHTVGGPVKVK